MLVSLGHTNRDLFTLTYEGQPGRQEVQVTFLGEVIDARPNMIKHTAITSEGRNRPSDSFDGQSIKLCSLVQLVRADSTEQTPIWTASVLFNLRHAVCQHRRVQCQALRIISGATSETSLHGVFKHEDIRALTTESHPLHDELQSNISILERLKRVIPWTKAARDALEEVEAHQAGA